MGIKKTSINFDEDLWKKMKKHCVDINKDVSKYLDELVRRDLKNGKV